MSNDARSEATVGDLVTVDGECVGRVVETYSDDAGEWVRTSEGYHVLRSRCRRMR